MQRRVGASCSQTRKVVRTKQRRIVTDSEQEFCQDKESNTISADGSIERTKSSYMKPLARTSG